MIVKQADYTDLKELSEIFDEYRQFYNQTSNVSKAFQFLVDRMEHQQSIVFLVREKNSNIIIGFTQLYPVFSSISLQRSYILNDLYVRPNFRRKKVAETLIQKAKEFVKSMSGKGLELSTAATNESAQSLYKKHGFVKEDEFLTYFWKA